MRHADRDLERALAEGPPGEVSRWLERASSDVLLMQETNGKPIPSDHAPLLLDLDEPGRPIDPGWEAAEARLAARAGKA